MSYRVSNFLRTAIKLHNSTKLLTTCNVTTQIMQKQITRSLWSISNNSTISNYQITQTKSLNMVTKRNSHGKAEQELVEFLTEEILAERKAQKTKTLSTELEGFKVQLNGAEVRLTKQVDNETIKISWNVNHTVDTDVEPEVHPNMDKPELGELKSKPAFKIELQRNDTTLCLLCSFLENTEDDGYNDVFGVDEISIYNGEWNENVYAVSGEVLDTYLYDLIMNYLEAKGISNEFVEKLSNYSTAYEHSAYIGLLEGLSKYISGK